MKTKQYQWKDVDTAAQSILSQMFQDEWRPDYIVGLNRGGLALAVLLSHLAKTRMYTLDVNLRDGDGMGPESNCWMAEDAFGSDTKKHNILIVDNINDTGATFEWIKEDWQSSVYNSDEAIWGDNVRFAVMTENLSSDFGLVKYYWDTVSKAEEDILLTYPWELK